MAIKLLGFAKGFEGGIETFKNSASTYAPARLYRKGDGGMFAYLASPSAARKWGIRHGERNPGNGLPYIVGGKAEGLAALGDPVKYPGSRS